MFDYTEHYQAVFFASCGSVPPSPQVIGKLLQAFSDKTLVPMTTQQVSLIPGQAPVVGLQLQLATPDMAWLVAFEPARVVIQRSNVPKTCMCTTVDFVREATDIAQRLCGVVDVRANRLGFNTRGLMPEESVPQLQARCPRVLRLVPFYSENVPCEWNTRTVGRERCEVGGQSETLNVIADINRTQGSITHAKGTSDFDRIQIGFDINTHQGNTLARFALADLGGFLETASALAQKLATQIEGLLNGVP